MERQISPDDSDEPCSPVSPKSHRSVKSTRSTRSDLSVRSIRSSFSLKSGLSSLGPKAGGFVKILVFTINVLIGLVLSQFLAAVLPEKVYKVWYEIARMATMWCLSFIMINVGYEFVIDKSNMRQYAGDYFIAMTAAGFPWVFVAVWYMTVLPNPLPWDQALLAARFAAPTSAGVLFCMLEAAGLKETWLFKKARILAIFDDLDTILLMIPLKAIIIGMKWELFLVLAVLVALVVLAYWKLHAISIWKSWRFSLLYAFVITAITELIYYFTKNHIEMEAVHLEVLLPAFVVGAIARENEEGHGHHATPSHEQEERVCTIISAIFMVLVGLSMPSLFQTDSDDGDEESLEAHEYIFHVAVVSLLMVLGKMFPVCCYRAEANIRTRFALALGMCPRGEVGAGVIVISLALDVKGAAVPISIISLALNIALSGGFIFCVTKLVSRTNADGSVKWTLQRKRTHLFDAMPTYDTRSHVDVVKVMDVNETSFSPQKEGTAWVEKMPVSTSNGWVHTGCVTQPSPVTTEGGCTDTTDALEADAGDAEDAETEEAIEAKIKMDAPLTTDHVPGSVVEIS